MIKIKIMNGPELSEGEIIGGSDELCISQKFEISKLSESLPKLGYYIVVLTIIFYLYVGITSNGFITGNNLTDIIGK